MEAGCDSGNRGGAWSGFDSGPGVVRLGSVVVPRVRGAGRRLLGGWACRVFGMSARAPSTAAEDVATTAAGDVAGCEGESAWS